MSSLSDLPIELLVLILEQLGGRELRRGQGSARLTVCKTWYSAALPVYLSGFGTSSIQLYGYNVKSVRNKFGYNNLQPLRHLMHKNTRELRFSLRGHPWDEATARADEDGEHTAWNQPPGDGELTPSMVLKAAETWRDSELKPCLDDVFNDLRHFEALEHITVEARSEPADDLARIPHCDYMYTDTISRLALNLPVTQNLVSLTLDTLGTQLLGDGHVCEMLASVVPKVPIVRLRMARICCDILSAKDTNPPDVRLESLIIKLHSPQSKSTAGRGSVCCPGNPAGTHLIGSLAQAWQSFVTGIEALISNNKHKAKPRLRISYVPATFPWVHVLDGSSWRQFRLKDAWHARETYGKPCWFEMEDEEMLVDIGSVTHCR